MDKIGAIKETNQVIVQYDKSNNKIVNEYLFKETIGKGAYSKVKKIVSLKSNQEYAVKIINKRLLRKKKKSYGKSSEGTLKIFYMIDDALNEIEIYKSLPTMNENILQLFEILNDDVNDKTYLIMELAEWGSIVTLNEKTGKFLINSHYTKFNEHIIKGFILDIAKGLYFLHSNNIVHRDIKSDNIVITKKGKAKIADLGSSIKITTEDKFSKTEGNLYFYPPEFCDGTEKKSFAFKPVDIWALGVTLYTCLFFRLPFMPNNSSNLVELFKLINEAKINYEKDEIIISNDLRTLLEHILDKDPKKRYTAKQIIEYSWLNKSNILI